jgi:hypothetical protein
MKIGNIYESLLDESMKTLNDIQGLILILIKNNNESLFLIYDQIKNIPLGYMSFGYRTDGDVYSIFGAYAKHGYGPLLYEIVMTYVYPKGITMSDEAGTSGEAQVVWEKFYSRRDIKKEPIKRLKKTDKEIDLVDACNSKDEECLKWINKILLLHRTKFIYKSNKSILDQMIINGKKYLNSNPNLDIDDMLGELEDSIN